MLPKEISLHRFDVDEYHRMGEAGLFMEDRVELIRGAGEDVKSSTLEEPTVSVDEVFA